MNKISEYRVNSALKNDTQLKLKVLKNEFISRLQILKILKKIFLPNKHQLYYYVICEEHDTEKTTLTRMKAKNVRKGVIYVDIPSDFENLEEAFKKAINLLFFEDISITTLLM